MKKPHPCGGATYDAFKTPPGAREPFMVGPFTCVMAPTKRAGARKSYSDNLSLGLLCNTPDNDGEGGVELIADGYRRQAIRLIGKDNKTLAIAHNVRDRAQGRVRYARSAGGPVPGIFNDADELEAYGVPIARTTGAKPANLKFAAHAIIVRAIRENA